MLQPSGSAHRRLQRRASHHRLRSETGAALAKVLDPSTSQTLPAPTQTITKDRHFAARRPYSVLGFRIDDVSAKDLCKLDDAVYNAVRNAGRAIENEQAALDTSSPRYASVVWIPGTSHISANKPIALELGYVGTSRYPGLASWAGGEGRCGSLVELDLIPDNSCATASNARRVSNMCGSWECGWVDSLAATTSAARLT